MKRISRAEKKKKEAHLPPALKQVARVEQQEGKVSFSALFLYFLILLTQMQCNIE